MTITAELLCQLLSYEPETGKLFWLPRPEHMFPENGSGGKSGNCKRWNGRFAWRQAFTTISTQGYYRGSIGAKAYTAHCLIWAMQTGEFCQTYIDHINGIKTDNRWNNLRAATRSQNAQNQGVRANNTSGVKGVSWVRRERKWCARVMIDRRSIHIGYFSDLNAATAAVRSARTVFHGYFCNHGDAT